MMQFEKQLANTDLNTYKTKGIKGQITTQVFKQIYQNLNYKTSEAVKRINRGSLKESTLKNYIDTARSYMFRNIKSNNPANYSSLYKVLDTLKEEGVKVLEVPSHLQYQPRMPKQNKKVNKTKSLINKLSSNPISSITISPDKFCIVSNGHVVKDYLTKQECLAYAEALEDTGKGLSSFEIKGIKFTD